jgi:peroxiredoxin
MSITGCTLLAGAFVLCAYQVKHGSAHHSELKVSVGQKATEFTLQDLSGRSWSLGELHGTNVLIDFWASWCGPCRVSMPHLQKLYEELQHSNFVVLAVSLDQTSEDIQKFANEKRLTFPVLWDKDHRVADLYGVNSIPTTVLVDKGGIVRHVEEGLNPYLNVFVKVELERQDNKSSALHH